MRAQVEAPGPQRLSRRRTESCDLPHCLAMKHQCGLGASRQSRIHTARTSSASLSTHSLAVSIGSDSGRPPTPNTKGRPQHALRPALLQVQPRVYSTLRVPFIIM